MESSLTYIFPAVANIVRYFIFAGISFLIFYILFPHKFSRSKIQARFAKNKDFVREILHSVQTSLIIGVVIALMLFTSLRVYTQVYDDISEYPLLWIPVSVILSLIVHDTYFYWMHRMLHHPRIYKYTHLVHHKSINPSPWTSYSFHFLEGIAEAMIVPIIMLLIPMHHISLMLFGFSSFVINVYGHLGFEITPKWFRKSWLFEILNTSVHHNLHHSHFNGNYGLYFRIWDRLMGTENPAYVKQYDSIQDKRFDETIAASTSQLI